MTAFCGKPPSFASQRSTMKRFSAANEDAMSARTSHPVAGISFQEFCFEASFFWQSLTTSVELKTAVQPFCADDGQRFPSSQKTKLKQMAPSRLWTRSVMACQWL